MRAIEDCVITVDWLRAYAADNGFSHGDYADTMRTAADTIEAQAAEIERQNATIDSYINTAAVVAAKVEAQSAEIERLKASFTNELDSLSNRNYQLRMANADQAALLKRCKEAMGWHYRCTDCTEELAAIEQYEQEYGK